MNHPLDERRAFLKHILYGGMGVAALSSMQMSLMNAVLAQSNSESDYKALVCVFLFGGNDSYNMLRPMEGEALTDYQMTRQNLARSQAFEISPGSQQVDGGIGLVPELLGMKTLFDQGNLAIQANVGTLIRPTSKTDIINKAVVLPADLYAHNSQQLTWQRGAELNQKDTGQTGWAGRAIDVLQSNSNAPFIQNVSVTGHNNWQVGMNTAAYHVDAETVETMNIYKHHAYAAIRKPILEQHIYHTSFSHLLAQSYNEVVKNAEDNAQLLTNSLSLLSPLDIDVPSNNTLALQLARVTDLIRLGKLQGLSRQVFFVGLGGWDSHNNQATNHPKLLTLLNDALLYFYQTHLAIGVENEVTSFTMSDFGRTLTSNGDGTDHGWGGHQFIMGGSVRGDLYGILPPQTATNEYALNGGRMIPTTASEQMFASLAAWYGVSETDLVTLFPNLEHFDQDVDYFSAV
ncbi:DUF1501 domain-containing protein [Shewanella surugensis]|uniref:DUF1501 domain-containing protein n=1 Tax=Shewanella surugensis TaxID=212020 RepID=A0ABT0LDY3_9GAMM|nr:DUF1501 domain-containing protein [Shewanella surugensis]MCL1125912.1 DUF1501 domain-containing protein [Shewanella surugensis]